MEHEDSFRHPIALRFRCTRCALCCGDTKEKKRHILLLKEEAEEIAKKISQPISKFAQKNKGKAPYSYEMKKTGKDGTCVFLKNKRCLIYRLRPLVCRFYPFELKNVKNTEHEFLYTNECPGVDRGKLLGLNHYAHLFKMAKGRLSPRETMPEKG